MTDRAMVAFAAFELESDNLVSLDLIDNLADNRSPGHQRRADLNRIPLPDQKHFGKSGRRANLGVKQRDLDHVALLDTVLLPASLDNCVSHRSS